MKTAAIYKITNMITSLVYIGSSADARRRIYVHGYLLDRRAHPNRFLQRAWDKHGRAAFSSEIVEVVADLAILLAREQHWIDLLRAADGVHGYNGCPVAGSRAGTRQPKSVAATLRAVHLGKPKSAEHRERIGAGNTGKTRSPEQRAVTREATIRQFSDPDARTAAGLKTIAHFDNNPSAREDARQRVGRTLHTPEARERQRSAVIASNKRRAEERRANLKV